MGEGWRWSIISYLPNHYNEFPKMFFHCCSGTEGDRQQKPVACGSYALLSGFLLVSLLGGHGRGVAGGRRPIGPAFWWLEESYLLPTPQGLFSRLGTHVLPIVSVI
jgi:hypothetical protein